MDLIGTKVLVALLFGIIRFCCGILPIQVCLWLVGKNDIFEKRIITESRRRKLDLAIARMHSFGGGVLFATCMLHMMPEVHKSVEELKQFKILKSQYPYSQFVVSLGFFVIYFLEEISHWIISKTPQEACGITNKHLRSPCILTAISNDSKLDINKCNQASTNVIEASIKLTSNSNSNEMVRLKNMELDVEEMPSQRQFEHTIEKQIKTKQQIIRCIFLISALSFHSMFEGFAIGLQHTESNIWYMFTAVSIHSAIVLFCIGLEIFLSGRTYKTTILFMFFLAITSPFGVLIGLLVSIKAYYANSSIKSFAVVFLEGLSTGAILYITFFEVLIREKERRALRTRRAIYIGAGFTMMAGLELIKFAE